VFLRDIFSGNTTRVSLSNTGAQFSSDSESMAITPNGRYVLFANSSLVYLRDVLLNTTTRIDLTNSGGEPNQLFTNYSSIKISPDGRYVLFESNATNLVT
jgi:Tol biopolymer transport system component